MKKMIILLALSLLVCQAEGQTKKSDRNPRKKVSNKRTRSREYFVSPGAIDSGEPPPSPAEREEATKNRVWFYVEQMPEFPGGLAAMQDFLAANIRYPEEAKRNKVEGKVYVRFVVEKEGELSDVVVMRYIGGGCDDEAARVVRMMPRWKPGRQNGAAVRVSITIPVNFSLDDGHDK